MAEREKVIQSLRRCIYDPDPGQTKKEFISCGECAYQHGCTHDLMRDTLALLKEQEPRILSLEEAIEGKNGLEIDPLVFVEIKGREDIFIGSVSNISHYNYPDPSFRVGESFRINRNFSEKIYLNIDYMKKVRCWTHKPSKEQRKAVPWDD